MARFGRSADYCEAIINTDDPVPSTSVPLLHAANFDVTNAAVRSDFVPLPGDSLHSWPAAWYGQFGSRLPAASGLPAHGVEGVPQRGSLLSLP